MKQVHKYISLVFVAGIMLSAQLYANISKDEAINILYANIADTASVEISMCDTIVPKGYSISNVTGNLICSPKEDSWFFFVDESPLANWAHNATCYCIGVDNGSLEKATTQMPPKGYGEMLLINAFRIMDEDATTLSTETDLLQTYATESSTATIWDNSENNYAMIISGGCYREINHKRYWNDCSFIYKTLIQKYKYKKENIVVLMSDGTDPAADMRVSAGIYKSSPLDLDGDGVADIKYAATYENVISTLEKYATTLTKGDHLFIYTIDHGSLTDDGKHSSLCLWNNGRLYDYELGNYIKQYSAKGINVNIVMGQCHSGGFIDYVNYPNVTIATACKKEEVSYALNLRYDAFVYYWTSAMNEMTPNGSVVSADYFVDGHITMQEAFIYAQTQDSEDETPQCAFGDSYSIENTTLYGRFPTIVGESILCDSSVYVLQNVPNGAEITWSYTEEGSSDMRTNPALLQSNYNMATFYRKPMNLRRTLQENINENSKISELKREPISLYPYVGTFNINATIRKNGAYYSTDKQIIMPDTIKPSIVSEEQISWVAGKYKTFIDTLYQDSFDSVIVWTAMRGDRVILQDTGTFFRVKGVPGMVKITATYVDGCDSYNTNFKIYKVMAGGKIHLTHNYSTTKLEILETDFNETSTFETMNVLDNNLEGVYTVGFYSRDGQLQYYIDMPTLEMEFPFDKLKEHFYVVKLFSYGVEIDSKKIFLNNNVVWSL